MTRAAPLESPKLPRPPSTGSVFAALMLATATGSGLTALLFAGSALLSPFGGGIIMAVSSLPLFFFFACPLWLAGLTAIGGPCWWILHRSGARSPWTAALAGALLTLLVAGGYVVLSSVPAGRNSIQAWMFVFGLTAISALTGWVLAKVAYPKKAPR